MDQTNTITWEINQLVKTNLFPNQQAVLRTALRALFEYQPEIKRQMVIRSYIASEISLGKAAQFMGVTHEEMKDILAENDVKINLGPLTTDELLEDAANA